MVSIIVPVYNAEKTIEKCIKSIIGQKGFDREIILVNDGSKDSSLDILLRYQNESRDIKVIDKANGGVSSARNAGLRQCTGEYVVFIDSDDFYLNDTYIYDMLCVMQDKAVDLVISGYTMLMENSNKTFATAKAEKSIVDVAQEYENYKNLGLMNSPWNKLFKKTLISEFFDEKMKMGEDAVFVLKYLSSCKMVSFCNNCGYGYVFMNNSSTADIRKKQAYDMSQSRIYHTAMYDFWKMFLTEEDVAQNYIKMRTDEVYLMICSLIRKKGLGAFLKTNISEVVLDKRISEFANYVKLLPKEYKHKKLSVYITKKYFKRIKVYCFFSILKAKIKNKF